MIFNFSMCQQKFCCYHVCLPSLRCFGTSFLHTKAYSTCCLTFVFLFGKEREIHKKQCRIPRNIIIFIDCNSNFFCWLSFSTKCLGSTINNNLSWDDHVNHVIHRVNSGLYALKKLLYMQFTSTENYILCSYSISHSIMDLECSTSKKDRKHWR